jgi:hypothetical protein
MAKPQGIGSAMNMSVDKAFNHQYSKAGSAIILMVKDYKADC